MNERAHQTEFLLHASGELARQALVKLTHARGLQQLRGPLGALGLFHFKQVRIEANVLIHREVFVKPEALRHITKTVLGALRIARHIEARDRSVARIYRHDSCQHAQRGRLPCPVGADQAEDFPGAHVKAQAIDRTHAGKALRQSFSHNRGLELVRHCLAGAAADGFAFCLPEARSMRVSAGIPGFSS